jgi:hypothetical protein
MSSRAAYPLGARDTPSSLKGSTDPPFVSALQKVSKRNWYIWEVMCFLSEPL